MVRFFLLPIRVSVLLLRCLLFAVGATGFALVTVYDFAEARLERLYARLAGVDKL